MDRVVLTCGKALGNRVNARNAKNVLLATPVRRAFPHGHAAGRKLVKQIPRLPRVLAGRLPLALPPLASLRYGSLAATRRAGGHHHPRVDQLDQIAHASPSLDGRHRASFFVR